jgi:methylisocitrate lyase
VGKIRAAVAARTDPDFVIVARTDSTDVSEACRRVRAFVEAGADMVFTINRCCGSYSDLRRVREAAGKPLYLHMLGWLEDLTYEQIRSVAGWASWGFPPLLTVIAALRQNLAALHRDKSSRSLPLPMAAMDEFKTLIGFPEIERLTREYVPEPCAPESV